MVDLAARKGAAFDDVDAVRQWLEGRQDCASKVGVVGFCRRGVGIRSGVHVRLTGMTRGGYLPASTTIHSLKACVSEDSRLPGRTSKK